MKSLLPDILIVAFCGIINVQSLPLIQSPAVEQSFLKNEINSNDALNPVKVLKQNNGNAGTAGTGNAQGMQGVPEALTNFIGTNVVDIVSSSLTGNLGGVFNGGLNLLNTNNRVNNLFGGVFGGTVPSPLGNIGSRLIITPSTTVRSAATQAAATSSSASGGTEEGGDDGDEDYDADRA